MRRLTMLAASLLAMLAFTCVSASAQQSSRVALVISNSGYQSAPPLATSAADAALMSETLKAAGYDVVEVHDVTKATIGDGIRALLDKMTAAGPQAVAFVYYAGYGAQLGSDNYLVPVDAQINTGDALSSEALPLSALFNALVGVPAAARIVVLDAARDHGFGKAAGQPVAPGLALIGAPPGMLIAYSSAPGTVAADGPGPNSPFALALNTVARQPGLDVEQIFKGVRLQVNQASNGAQVPYMVSALNVEVKLFDAPAAQATAPQTLAPALGVANVKVPPRTPRRVTRNSMRGMSQDEAYHYAIEQDSLETYQWFVEDHPRHSQARQVWDIINGRRQDILWRRAQAVGTRDAYWAYMTRYPSAAHGFEAQSWLKQRGLAGPPRDYAPRVLVLPTGYHDEAIGIVELVPRGVRPPPSVFDQRAPVMIVVPDARPFTRPTFVFTPPPQAPRIAAPPVIAARPANAVPQQPVQPTVVFNKGDPQQQKMMEDLQKRLANTPQAKTAPVSSQAVLNEVLKQLNAQKPAQPAPAAPTVVNAPAPPPTNRNQFVNPAPNAPTPPPATKAPAVVNVPPTTPGIPPAPRPSGPPASIQSVTIPPAPPPASPPAGIQSVTIPQAAPTVPPVASRPTGPAIPPPPGVKGPPPAPTVPPVASRPTGPAIPPPAGVKGPPPAPTVPPVASRPPGPAIPPPPGVKGPPPAPTVPPVASRPPGPAIPPPPGVKGPPPAPAVPPVASRPPGPAIPPPPGVKGPPPAPAVPPVASRPPGPAVPPPPGVKGPPPQQPPVANRTPPAAQPQHPPAPPPTANRPPPPQPPVANRTPPAAAQPQHPPAPPPTANRPPPQQPPVANRTPPAAVQPQHPPAPPPTANRPPQQPPVANRTPPAAAQPQHPPAPPPTANRPPQQPPVANRTPPAAAQPQHPPAPPPTANRPPQQPPVANRAPPQQPQHQQPQPPQQRPQQPAPQNQHPPQNQQPAANRAPPPQQHPQPKSCPQGTHLVNGNCVN